jgi:hypothetical protein
VHIKKPFLKRRSSGNLQTSNTQQQHQQQRRPLHPQGVTLLSPAAYKNGPHAAAARTEANAPAGSGTRVTSSKIPRPKSATATATPHVALPQQQQHAGKGAEGQVLLPEPAELWLPRQQQVHVTWLDGAIPSADDHTDEYLVHQYHSQPSHQQQQHSLYHRDGQQSPNKGTVSTAVSPSSLSSAAAAAAADFGSVHAASLPMQQRGLQGSAVSGSSAPRDDGAEAKGELTTASLVRMLHGLHR